MAFRRYSQFYSNCYSQNQYGYDTVRSSFAILKAASQQYENERKGSKSKSSKGKGKVLICRTERAGHEKSDDCKAILRHLQSPPSLSHLPGKLYLI